MNSNSLIAHSNVSNNTSNSTTKSGVKHSVEMSTTGSSPTDNRFIESAPPTVLGLKRKFGEENDMDRSRTKRCRCSTISSSFFSSSHYVCSEPLFSVDFFGQTKSSNYHYFKIADMCFAKRKADELVDDLDYPDRSKAIKLSYEEDNHQKESVVATVTHNKKNSR